MPDEKNAPTGDAGALDLLGREHSKPYKGPPDRDSAVLNAPRKPRPVVPLARDDPEENTARYN